MKKIILLAAAVALVAMAGWLPVQPRDVEDLLVVEVLVLSEQDGQLHLDGGNDLVGQGETWEEAVQDLTETAPGVAFFDTVAHIVLCDGTETQLEAVLDDRALRPAARLYMGRGDVESDGAAKYLATHRGSVTLQDLQAAWLEQRDVVVPLLTEHDGRYRLIDDG